MLTERDMRSLLAAKKAQAGTWEALAEELGFSVSYLHRVASGESHVPASVAAKLGFRRVETVTFEAVREAEAAAE